jgi:hypothetical protein
MVGGIFALAPIWGWSWPVLTPILAAMAGAAGFRLLTARVADRKHVTELDNRIRNLRRVEIPLEEHVKDIVAEQLGYEEELTFEKDDLLLAFGHDARGKFYVRVFGPKDRPAAELRAVGDQFARELIQQFAYNRIATELDRRGVQVVDESVDNEGNIVLTTRRW